MTDQENDAAASDAVAEPAVAEAPVAAPVTAAEPVMVAPAPMESPAEPAAYMPAGGPICMPTPAGKDPSAGALIICGSKVALKSEKRIVIAAEVRGDDGAGVTFDYPVADAYLRFTPDLDMTPGGAILYTLGDNLSQNGFTQFAPAANVVNVGPAHPAYAAANLAYNMGARDIEVTGLSDFWKAKLSIYFDQTMASEDPNFAVKITLT